MNAATKVSLLACCLALQAPAAIGCEAYWADFAGKGEDIDLKLARTWSLAELRSMRPAAVVFVPGADASSASQYRPELQWVPGAGTVSPVAQTGALQTHWIRYSASQALLAWGRDDDALCPVLMVDGDPSIVEELRAPEPVVTGTETLLHVRVLISGSGRFQSALFVGMDEGALVHLNQQDFVPLLRSQDVQLHHRGGSFCPETLTWEGIGWRGTGKDESGIWRVQYLRQGRELRIASAELIQGGTLSGSLCPESAKVDRR